ncbi:MAG: membrane protein insertase YidC, partial [Cyclobacteriaceae bacterium]
MDRNQIIGLVLMMGFITIYFAFFAPEPVEPVAQPATTETTTQAPTESDGTSEAATPQPQMSDSARAQMNESRYGAFSAASVGIEKKIEVKNEDVRFVFNSKGAVIEEAELLKYKDWKGDPLLLVTPTTSDQHFYVDHLGKNIDLNEFYYQTSQKVKADTTILTFQLNVNEYAYVRYNYSIPPAGYQVKLKIETKGMNDLVGEKITYAWNHQYNRLEMDMTDARGRSTVRYNLIGDEVDYLSNRSTELEEETLETPVKWIAFKQKFFTTAVIADDQFKSAFVSTRVDENDTTIEKVGDFQAIVPYEKFVAGNLGMTYYFGPNDFDIMRKVTPEFEQNVNMGWSILTFINKHFIRHIF